MTGYRPGIEAFESGDIDPDRFDHEAHVYVGWSLVRRYGLMEGARRFSEALKRLTRRLGQETKYHETITWFFMLAIAERLLASPGDDWESFSRANRDLTAGAGTLPRRYYSPERLSSPEARRRFLAPDLCQVT